MKEYKFELIIREGSDIFWRDIEDRKVTGCEEVKQLILDCLFDVGIDPIHDCSNDELNLINYNQDCNK